MIRVPDFTNAVGYCALIFVVYKVLNVGPYEATIFFGRCLHVFIAAAQGYV